MNQFFCQIDDPDLVSKLLGPRDGHRLAYKVGQAPIHCPLGVYWTLRSCTLLQTKCNHVFLGGITETLLDRAPCDACSVDGGRCYIDPPPCFCHHNYLLPVRPTTVVQQRSPSPWSWCRSTTFHTIVSRHQIMLSSLLHYMLNNVPNLYPTDRTWCKYNVEGTRIYGQYCSSAACLSIHLHP